MLNNKIDPKKIAEDFARKGLIPEDYTEEFAAGLVQELRRESLRFGNGVAALTSKAVMRGRLTSEPLAA